MENGAERAKFVAAGVLAVIFMCATAVPALANDDDSPSGAQYGDNIEIGDINAQVCQNIVGDINVAAEQYNSGDQTAIGDGNIQAIAQEQNVSVEVVQACFQLLNTGTVAGGSTQKPADPGKTTTPGGVITVGEDQIVAASVPHGKPLAATGGFSPSAASMLLPAGALLMAFGATMFYLRGSRA